MHQKTEGRTMRTNLLLSSIFAAVILQAQVGQPPGGMPRTTTPATNPMDRPGYDANQQDDRNTAKFDEKRFIQDAYADGLAQVELGKLAVQKASNDAVKQFAQKMVDDHSKANDALKAAAAHQNITFPDSLDSKRQSKVDKLAKLSGADFDRAYIKGEVKDHQQDVRDFQQEAKSGSDADVKSFASKTLPILEDHLTTAKELDKNKKTTASK
jgi:putative membrane protein